MNNLNKNNNRNPKSTRSTFVIAMSVLVALSLWMFFSSMLLQPNGDEIEYTQFLTKMKEEGVSAVKYSRQDGKIYGLDTNTTRDPDDLPGRYDFFVIMPDAEQFRADTQAIIAKQTNVDANLVDATEYGFTFDYQKATDFTLLSFIPYLFLIGSVFFLFFMMRQQGNGSSFGKSKARVITNEVTKVKFTDVAGADEEKEELAEIVDFLKNPKYFSELGAHVPKGVLLMGPPGTGKTLLAKAVAGEANVPFYSMSGAGFVELFVGVGASRVRDLFATAKKSAPAIIFIDEIDAVGRQRSAGGGGGAQDEREQTLNQLLVEMDGFDPNSGIIVIAATNRSDVLDPALLRPGRFDRRVVVNPPDVKGREEILKIHSRNKKLGSDVNLQVLAQRTPGFTGADLENVLNEAAILAVREGKSQINMSEVEEAITRGLVGLEKKNRVISEADKRLTAYHEVGHAIVAREVPNCDSVHEISIIPRGQAGGYTLTLPDQDTAYTTKQQLLDNIAMLLGGRVSEAVYLGEISTGASSDLQRATETARQMVTRYGMSSKIGPIFLGNEPDMMTGMGFGFSQGPLYSEEVASKVDEEIRLIIEDAYERANKILTEHREAVEAVVKVLIEKERIRGDEFEEICLNVHDYAPAKDTTLKNDTDPAIDQIIE